MISKLLRLTLITFIAVTVTLIVSCDNSTAEASNENKPRMFGSFKAREHQDSSVIAENASILTDYLNTEGYYRTGDVGGILANIASSNYLMLIHEEEIKQTQLLEEILAALKDNK